MDIISMSCMWHLLWSNEGFAVVMVPWNPLCFLIGVFLNPWLVPLLIAGLAVTAAAAGYLWYVYEYQDTPEKKEVSS